MVVDTTRKLIHLFAGFVFNSVGSLSSPEKPCLGTGLGPVVPTMQQMLRGYTVSGAHVDCLVIINIYFFNLG